MKLFWTICVSLFSISAFADVEVVTNVVGGTSINNLAGLMVGGKFQNNSGQAINITKIGRYVLPGNSGIHKIVVFTGDTGDYTLMASNNVDLAGATVNTFKYVNLTTSVTIPNSGIFWVLSEETDGGDSWYLSADVIAIPDIGVVNSGYFDNNLHNNDGAVNKLHGPTGFQIGEATGPSGGSGNAPAPQNFRTVPFEFGDNDGGWIDVVVAWDYPYTGQTGFNCRVSTNHVDWYLIASAQAIERGIDTLRVPWTSNLWFKVAAKNLSGESTNYSNEIMVVGNMPPSHLTGRSVLTNQMYLQCEGVGGLIDGYTFRWATNSTFSPSNTFLTASQTATNMTLTNNFLPNVRYYFQVVSTSVGGDSEVFDKPTNYISVIVNGVPDAPTFISQHMTENVNESQVLFDRVSLNELGYSLEFTTNNGSTWIVQPVAYDNNETRTVVTMSSMIGGVLYSNRLAATNILGHSPYVYWTFIPPATPVGSHTIYYVSPTPPVGGNGTGTNWANSWTLGGINWSILNPGDTIYLSGGNYTNYMVSFGSGTQANPINIRASQEVGHNSHINIYGQLGFRSHWVTVSGSNGTSFASSPLSLMTNNIGISVFGRGDATQEVWIGVDCIGLVTEFCEFAGAGNELSGEGAIAVHFLPNLGGPTNCVLRYVWIHDNFAHGIGADAIGTTYQGYRAIVLDHCLIENNHNNFISAAGSMHIENCVLGPWKSPGIGHPDGYQGGINYLTAVNNIWKNSGGSMFYANLQGSFFAPGVEGAHDCYFINNIYINDVTNIFSTGCDIQWNMDANSVGGLVLSNVYWLNNTFFGRKGLSYTFSSRTNNTLKQIKFENNLFLSGDQSSAGQGSFSTGGGIIPTTNDFVFNYNSVSGPQKIIFWNGVQYSSVDTFPIFTNNRSGTPDIISQNGLKFQPVFTDTNIVNRGTNLAVYRPFFQSNAATNDFVGTPRDSQWDIGAFEMSTNRGPVIWYTFEQDFYSGITKYLPDVSGNNHPGLRFGRPASMTNYPTRSDGYDGGYAGRFTYYTNDIQNGQPQYFTGDYVAMTNVTAELRAITNFTVAFWAYIRERNNDMTFVGGGGALGHGNFAIKTVDNYTEVAIVTNGVRVEEGHLMVFPDIGISNTWVHLAVTWSGTNHTLKGYYNGLPFATNTSLTSLYAITFDRNSYIGNGCWTFDEDPWIFPTADGGPDNHPNNAWLAGSMDDYRVYTITLDDSEILGLLGGGVAQSNFTPPPEPPATNTFNITVQSFNPDSGVSISATPDNNLQGAGTTTFVRNYNETAITTLTTPATLTGKTFSKWQKDGNNLSSSTSINVTVDANHTLTAFYTNNATPPPTNTYTVTVQSLNPNAGVTISTTVDNNGNGGGPTSFVRTFNENAIMVLLAPYTLTGVTFSKWTKGGVNLSSNITINLLVNSNQTVVAVYTNNPAPAPTPPGQRKGPFKKNH